MLEHRGMVHIILLPNLCTIKLFKYACLNKKASGLLEPKSNHLINYKVLYQAHVYEVSLEDEAQSNKSYTYAFENYSKHIKPTMKNALINRVLSRISPSTGLKELIGSASN